MSCPGGDELWLWLTLVLLGVGAVGELWLWHWLRVGRASVPTRLPFRFWTITALEAWRAGTVGALV